MRSGFRLNKAIYVIIIIYTMKQKVRKALAISGMAIVMGTAGIATHNANAYNPERKAFSKNEHRNKEQFKNWQEYRNAKREGFKDGNHGLRGIRMIPGVVTAISDTTITIKRGDRTFSIQTTETTKLLDRKWNTITKNDIKVGNKLRVRGTVVENTITAKTIRNISLPKIATSATQEN